MDQLLTAQVIADVTTILAFAENSTMAQFSTGLNFGFADFRNPVAVVTSPSHNIPPAESMIAANESPLCPTLSSTTRF